MTASAAPRTIAAGSAAPNSSSVTATWPSTEPSWRRSPRSIATSSASRNRLEASLAFPRHRVEHGRQAERVTEGEREAQCRAELDGLVEERECPVGVALDEGDPRMFTVWAMEVFPVRRAAAARRSAASSPSPSVPWNACAAAFSVYAAAVQ